jgi:hypothetical protein
LCSDEASVAGRVHVEQPAQAAQRAFIKAAKKAGIKFSIGANNADRSLGCLEYGVGMVKECGLTWQDIFVPKPDGEKRVQKRTLS